MRKTRNLYKNRLEVSWLSYTMAVGLVILGFGCGYVYLKNQHHAKEDRKLEVQAEIRNTRTEIGRLGNQILAAMAAESLRPRLAQAGSPLLPIPPEAVVRLPLESSAPAGQPEASVASASP